MRSITKNNKIANEKKKQCCGYENNAVWIDDELWLWWYGVDNKKESCLQSTWQLLATVLFVFLELWLLPNRNKIN